MKVMLLQPYLAPYRVGLFNAMVDSKKIDSLYVLYYSTYDKRRRWVFDKEKKFDELKALPLWNKIPNLFKVFQCIRRIRPDAVIGFPNLFGFFVLFLSRIYRYEILAWSEMTSVTERDRHVSKLKLFLRGFYFRHSAAVLVPGKLAKQYLVDMYAIPDGRFYWTPNTVDETFAMTDEAVREKFLSNDRIRVVFSGNFLPYKGIDLLYSVFLENIGVLAHGWIWKFWALDLWLYQSRNISQNVVS